MITRIGRAAAVVGLVLAGVIGANAPEAGAKAAPAETAELAPMPGSPDADADGMIKVTRKGERAKLLIKLRRLDRKTRYDVRDARDGRLLRTVRTNRRGKAKLKLRDKRRAGKAESVGDTTWVSVHYHNDGRPVLEGGFEKPGLGDLPSSISIGFEFYGKPGSTTGSAYMLSVPDKDLEVFALTVQPAFDRDSPALVVHSFHATNQDDAGLPVGASLVGDFAGHAFEVRDADGNVELSGHLPHLKVIDLPHHEDHGNDDTGNDTGNDRTGTDRGGDAAGTRKTGGNVFGYPAHGDDPNRLPPDFEPPDFPDLPELDAELFLFIADHDGVFEAAGALRTFDLSGIVDFEIPDFGDLPNGIPGLDDR